MKSMIANPARSAWLAGASAIALGAVVVPAHAVAAPALLAVTQSGTAVEELVVTARRREERLQDVPQSVTSVTGEALVAAGVGDTNSLMQVSPSLNLPRSGTNLQPMIRGIGTTNSSFGDEPNTAIYLDGVYQAVAAANSFALTSIQRVEVLKGPQGTLFGRNSTGGAILITTKEPSHDFGGEMTIGYGNLEHASFSSYVTGGLGDKVAADLAVGFEQWGKYYTNILDGHKLGNHRNIIVRPKFVIDFDEDTKATVGLAFFYSSDTRANIYGIANRNVSYRNLPAGANFPVPTEPRTTAIGFDPVNIVWDYQGYIRLQRDFETFTLSSQTSITRDHSHNRLDTDYGPLALGVSIPHAQSTTYQQEFLASSAGDTAFEWVGGLFLYKAKAGQVPRLTGTSANGVTPLAFTATNSTMTSWSYAPFGEVTYNLSDRFSVTGGARYTYERKRINGFLNTNPDTTYPARKWTSFTPRVVVQYIVPETVNLYGSVSRGFKSGVFQTTAIPPNPAVNPENLTTYEVGLKTLAAGNWRFSSAVFYNDYKDIQVLSFLFPVGVLTNAAEGKTYGFEAEVNTRVTEQLTVNAFVSYSHTEYTRFTTAITNTPRIVNGVAVGGNVTTNNVDVSGSRFLRAPTWLAGANFTYRVESEAGEYALTGNAYYNSGYSMEITNRNRQEAYIQTNASLSFTPRDSDVTFSLWVNNIGNEDIAITGNSAAFGDNIIYGAPRTWGLRVNAKFD